MSLYSVILIYRRSSDMHSPPGTSIVFLVGNLRPKYNNATTLKRRPDMNITKLLHTRMRVSDMELTIAFYRDTLGLEVIDQKVSPRGSHLAFLAVPNSEELIELCSFPASGSVSVQEDLVHLAFQVEDLDATIRELNEKKIRSPSWFTPRCRMCTSLPEL